MIQKDIFISKKSLDRLTRFHLIFAPIAVIGLIVSLVLVQWILSIVFGALMVIAIITSIVLHFADRKAGLYKINSSFYE